MNILVYWAAVTGGNLAGLLEDPTTWAFIAVVAAAGFNRARWLVLLLIIGVATAIHIAMVYSWWVELGMADRIVSKTLWQAWLKLLLAAPIFALARALAGLRARRA